MDTATLQHRMLQAHFISFCREFYTSVIPEGAANLEALDLEAPLKRYLLLEDAADPVLNVKMDES